MVDINYNFENANDFSNQPIVSFRIIRNLLPVKVNKSVTEVEQIYYLWEAVNFERNLELSVRNTTNRQPNIKATSPRPRTASIRVRLSPDLTLPQLGAGKVNAQATTVRSQIFAIEYLWGKVVQVIHRSGTIVGVVNHVSQVDEGETVNSAGEGTVIMNIEVTETRVDGSLGGGIGYEIGKAVFPKTPDPATEATPAGAGGCDKKRVTVTNAVRSGVGYKIGNGARNALEGTKLAVAMTTAATLQFLVDNPVSRGISGEARIIGEQGAYVGKAVSGFVDGLKAGAKKDKKFGDC